MSWHDIIWDGVIIGAIAIAAGLFTFAFVIGLRFREFAAERRSLKRRMRRYQAVDAAERADRFADIHERDED